MVRALPPLTWFRAFECAARHLSFTHAAEELNVTQSAVSQHVRLLETRFGTSLFVRKARGIELTEAGRRLIPYVSGAMSELSVATEIFVPPESDNALEIACSNSFARLWLCRHIGDFLTSHFQWDVRIISAVWHDDYRKLNADVQIRYGSVELAGDGAEQLLQDVMVPVCHPDLMLQFGGLNKDVNVPLIHTMGTTNTWDRFAKQLEIDLHASSSISVDSDELALELAENGRGIALCGRFLCTNMVDAGRLCIPVERAMPSDETYYIAVNEDQHGDTRAIVFRNWLKEVLDTRPGA